MHNCCAIEARNYAEKMAAFRKCAFSRQPIKVRGEIRQLVRFLTLLWPSRAILSSSAHHRRE